ncbi:MAG TPA: ABC transporter [Planctomycetaceae bacterium]|nr:ABC transporter [Planctomycetaceae bacterium]
MIAGHALERLSQEAADAFRMHHLGVIFQQFNLLDCFNVWDNVAFTARLKGNYNASRQQTLLNNLGLAKRHKAPVSMLSGGEQQRVAIARALNHLPDVVLADEPTGNLDSTTGQEIMALLASLNELQQLTIIMVTHDERIACQAHRIVRLGEGRVETVSQAA